MADEGNARGWSQRDVANKIGRHQSTVSRWMNYEGIEGWSIKDVLVLEEVLGLPHGDLTLSVRELRAQRRALVDVMTDASLAGASARDVAAMVSKIDSEKPPEPRRRASSKTKKR